MTTENLFIKFDAVFDDLGRCETIENVHMNRCLSIGSLKSLVRYLGEYFTALSSKEDFFNEIT